MERPERPSRHRTQPIVYSVGMQVNTRPPETVPFASDNQAAISGAESYPDRGRGDGAEDGSQLMVTDVTLNLSDWGGGGSGGGGGASSGGGGHPSSSAGVPPGVATCPNNPPTLQINTPLPPISSSTTVPRPTQGLGSCPSHHPPTLQINTPISALSPSFPSPRGSQRTRSTRRALPTRRSLRRRSRSRRQSPRRGRSPRSLERELHRQHERDQERQHERDQERQHECDQRHHHRRDSRERDRRRDREEEQQRRHEPDSDEEGANGGGEERLRHLAAIAMHYQNHEPNPPEHQHLRQSEQYEDAAVMRFLNHLDMSSSESSTPPSTPPPTQPQIEHWPPPVMIADDWTTDFRPMPLGDDGARNISDLIELDDDDDEPIIVGSTNSNNNGHIPQQWFMPLPPSFNRVHHATPTTHCIDWQPGGYSSALGSSSSSSANSSPTPCMDPMPPAALSSGAATTACASSCASTSTCANACASTCANTSTCASANANASTCASANASASTCANANASASTCANACASTCATANASTNASVSGGEQAAAASEPMDTVCSGPSTSSSASSSPDSTPASASASTTTTPSALALVPKKAAIVGGTAAASSSSSSSSSSVSVFHSTKFKLSESQTEDMVGSILNVLECPVCLECMSAPIRQCNEGHLICSSCFARLTACPKCRAPLALARNRALEQIVEVIPLPCTNWSTGCREMLILKEKNVHETKCGFRQYPCPVAHGTCTWTGYRPELPGHITLVHPSKLLTNNQVVKVSLLPGSRSTWLLYEFDEIFRVTFVMEVARGRLIGWVSCYGSMEDAEKFTYRMSLKKEGKPHTKLVFTRRVHREEEEEVAAATGHVSSERQVSADAFCLHVSYIDDCMRCSPSTPSSSAASSSASSSSSSAGASTSQQPQQQPQPQQQSQYVKFKVGVQLHKRNGRAKTPRSDAAEN